MKTEHALDFWASIWQQDPILRIMRQRKKLAARFASMGVNVIRLHAADAPIGEEPCTWSSCKEAPLLDYERGNSLEFNKAGLDRFDYFVAKLKEKGIYLHIDLLVARAF
ncbi:hypothetical protein ROSEINA2194_01346 [Roseburia inulinivorans DSM 16841]|uniref:Uncharacterized protein n=1 Tax=Roseburia inulinivorans DSM 16841 TaxID=622312 RepID=C0FRI5_9FIRM|nr:hypothetical protein ROSEINA2194_01346 [Roseburia inulinivorans DSM 16841]